MMKSRLQQITIVGAGPIGLEAALYARTLGYEVTVFERGEVGASVRDWGFISMFSPWSLNCSPLGQRALREGDPAWTPPDDGVCPTGQEYAERYLLPLSRLPALRGCIETQTEVLAVGREGLLKGDLIGDPCRGGHPFRILVRDRGGQERVHRADVVIDASGTYGHPNWIGSGGIPAPGERANAHRISYRLEDIAGAARLRYAGRRTLLVGGGYSAATTAVAFEALIREVPGTSLLWVSRTEDEMPYQAIPDDRLPSRAALIASAIQIVSGRPGIEYHRCASVEAIRYADAEGRFGVTLRINGETREAEVDRVIGNVGYSPDSSIYRELQVHECYATCGPIDLAASLLALSPGLDCLAQASAGPEALKNPEPNFYILGAKSYGRNSTFLIRLGLEQVRDVFTLIAGDSNLDLYRG
jgi:thioredoxin reductase